MSSKPSRADRQTASSTSGGETASPYSEYIVLLARQRSGTYAVRSVLESHPDIFGVEEIFHLRSAEDPGTGETNFFVFLKKQAGRDALRLLPVDYESLFLEYLEYLRGFTTKRFIVLDVKYNTVHHVMRNFQPLVGIPYLFRLMVRHRLRAFVLTRRNYLRAWISMLKARATKVHHLSALDQKHADRKIRLDVAETLAEFRRWAAEDQLVRDAFPAAAASEGVDYRRLQFTWDYADIFEAPGEVLPDFRQRFADWLGVPDRFAARSPLKKLSSWPLSDTIENYREVALAFKKTPFELFLKDEPMYSSVRQASREGLAPLWRNPFRSSAPAKL